MIVKGFILIALIILSSIGLLVSFVLFVIRLASDHPKKWHWLAGTAGSLLVLIFSVMIFIRKVVTKATEFGTVMQEKFENAVEQNAKSNKQDFHYELLDSNSTIAQLKDFEIMNHAAHVPDEFYVYLGFLEYYRMPITYPYALHCTDVLETASLFNEEKVTEFNSSDNGEIDCGINNITAFAFDNKVLIAKKKDEKGEAFVVYNFGNSEIINCDSKKEAFIKAKEFDYSGADTLVSVLNYYRLFNK